MSEVDANTINKLKSWLEELENVVNSPDFQLPFDKYKSQIDDLREEISQLSKSFNETKSSIYKKDSFKEYFNIYLKYIEDNKTSEINYDYCTLDGIRLGEWVRTVLNQKIKSGILEDYYVEKLKNCPYETILQPFYWDEWLDIAISLIKPEQYNHIPDIKYNNVYTIGKWLKRQIRILNTLNQERQGKITSSFEWLINPVSANPVTDNPVRVDKDYSLNNVDEPIPVKNTKSVLSLEELLEKRWIIHIKKIKDITTHKNQRLDPLESSWLQRRIIEYLPASGYRNSYFNAELTRKYFNELYALFTDLLIEDKIDFVTNSVYSINDIIDFYKRIVNVYEKDEQRKELLNHTLNSKYGEKLTPLTDFTHEYINTKSNCQFLESSLLSIAQVYVNTCESNVLSARQNADILRSSMYSIDDLYGFF